MTALACVASSRRPAVARSGSEQDAGPRRSSAGRAARRGPARRRRRSAAPRACSGADEDARRSGARRPHGERPQPRPGRAHLVERRPGRPRHRLELGEHRQHPLRAAQRDRRERRAAREPFAPGALGREARRAGRSAAGRSCRRCSRFCRSRSIRAIRGESGSSRASRAMRGAILGSQPVQALLQRSLPPITAASTSSCSHRHGARTVPATTGASSASGSCRACPPASGGLQARIPRSRQARGSRLQVPPTRVRRPAARRPRRAGHLAEREILGEPSRRQPFRGAGEQRQQRAPGRIGPGRCRARSRPGCPRAAALPRAGP